MRLLSHEIGFDLADSLHPARYRDNAVQEFVPASRRGFVGGLVTAFIPIGVMIGSILGAFLAPLIGWRGLFACGLVPALLTLMIRAWVPESPRWWCGWADPRRLAVPSPGPFKSRRNRRRCPRSMKPLRAQHRGRTCSNIRAASSSPGLSNLGMQTTGYGVILWAPTLFVMLLGVSPAQASYLFIFVSLAGFVGRFVFSGLSELIGRRAAGALQGFGSAAMIVAAGLWHDSFLGTVSVFWLLIVAADFFFDGGSAIMGPYAAEVWPSALRTSGMGSAYGFGGIGKIIGPLGSR
jgi:putative MFS transporter